MENKNIEVTCSGADSLPIDSLSEFQGNLKKLGENEYNKLKSSIEKYGFSFPIFVWKNGKNNILDGHQRLNALKKMRSEGFTIANDSVPVAYIEAKDEKEAKKKVLLATSQYAKPSNESLYDFLTQNEIDFNDIKMDIDIPQIDLDRFENEFYHEIIEDEAPPLPQTAISKQGEIYQLGRHRIMCGNATSKEDVEKLMDGKMANVIFTDPPYGVNYGKDNKELQEKSGGKFSKTRKQHTVKNDGMNTKDLAETIWRPSFKNLFDFSNDDCSFYMTMCQGGDQMMMMMMMSENWQVKHELIWVKNSPVFSMGRLDYDYQHEPILFGWKNKHKWYGGGDFTKSIWEIPKPLRSDLHPTMKPIALMTNALLNSSQRNEICLDLFGGSGSTLIACEQNDRVCYMMEIDPLYCDVIRKRYENFVKQK